MHTREVDGAIVVGVHLVDHILQLRLAWVLAEGSHNGAQFLGGDLACSAVSLVMFRWEVGNGDASDDKARVRRGVMGGSAAAATVFTNGQHLQQPSQYREQS